MPTYIIAIVASICRGWRSYFFQSASYAFQQEEFATLTKCNKPSCSRCLFESQYQPLCDDCSLPCATAICTHVYRSPVQTSTSLKSHQHASSTITVTSINQTQSAMHLSSSDGCLLSVAISDFSESVITPIKVLKAIWRKAIELLHEPNSILPAPGQGDNAWMVRNYSWSCPHLVTCKRNGRDVCDNKWPNWQSLGIRVHSVAAAEDNHEPLLFVSWFTKAKKVPNIAKLATTEMPAGRGCKRSKAPPKKWSTVQPESRIPFSVVSGMQGEHSSSALSQTKTTSSTFQSISNSSSAKNNSNMYQGTATVTMSIESVEIVDTPSNLIIQHWTGEYSLTNRSHLSQCSS